MRLSGGVSEWKLSPPQIGVLAVSIVTLALGLGLGLGLKRKDTKGLSL